MGANPDMSADRNPAPNFHILLDKGSFPIRRPMVSRPYVAKRSNKGAFSYHYF
jgi:hypothetical protein